jgi:hypothetical protein
MEASVFSFFVRTLLASPVTYMGFIVAIVVPLALEWKPNKFLWLLALLLNFPSLQVLYLASAHYGSWVDGNLDHRVDAPPMAVVDTLLIFLWGTGGAGFGSVLWLIVPKRIFGSAIQEARAIFSRSFWKARQPD